MVHHHYNLVLVLLSYVVAVIGSFTALRLTTEIPRATTRRQRIAALCGASAVMGVGAIWAMHFIAMQACRMPFPVSYDIGLTLLSALIAVLACMLGLALTGLGTYSLSTVVTAGTYMGLGVAAMHYLGMAAMRMPAFTVYDAAVVALSVVIAMLASIAALWLAFKRRGILQTFFGSLVMGLAVCGMHYTGMSGARFVPDPALAVVRGGLGGTYLGMVVFAIVAVLLVLVLVGTIMRQQRHAAIGL